jgi:NADH dehydrogenase
MILVVGATGMLGLEVCRRLSAANRPVRAMVRAGSAREAELRTLGVEVVHGDLRSREAVDRACTGATAVISTATAMASKDRHNSLRAVDRDGQLAVVEAARSNGVGHFVYVSISPNYRERAPLMRYNLRFGRRAGELDLAP